MKSIRQVSFLIVLAATVLFTSLDSSAQQIYRGNDLVQMLREHEKADRGDPSKNFFRDGFYVGYVAGVYDSTGFFFTPPENVTLGQICSIVAKHLKENPERWTLPASILVLEALIKAFPKR